MAYTYEIKQIPNAFGFEWAVTETDTHETKELVSSNTNIVGMFINKELAYDYIEERKRRISESVD